MQKTLINKSFKNFGAMPVNLQLRLLSNIQKKSCVTSQQIEAKLLKAELLKQKQQNEFLSKLMRHHQQVSQTSLRQDKETKQKLMVDLLNTRMQIAGELASQSMVQKILNAQKYGSGAVLQARQRKLNLVQQVNPIKKYMIIKQQECAKNLPGKDLQESQLKAKEAIANKQHRAQLTRETLVHAKIQKAKQFSQLRPMQFGQSMQDKIKQKHKKAQERYQQILNEKVKKAQKMGKIMIVIKNQMEPINEEKPEFVQKNEEVKNEEFQNFDHIKVNNFQRDQVIRQMEPTIAQQMSSVSWRIAVDSFQKVTGSDKVKNSKAKKTEVKVIETKQPQEAWFVDFELV